MTRSARSLDRVLCRCGVFTVLALCTYSAAAQTPFQDIHDPQAANPRSSTGLTPQTLTLPPSVHLTGKPIAGRWVAVLPLEPGAQVAVLPVKDGDRQVVLEGSHAGSSLLCVGGEKAATLCQKVLLRERGSVAVEGPVPGVRVIGQLLMGSAPASGVEVRVLPYPQPSEQLVTVPLYRDEKRLVTTLTTDAEGRFAVPLLAPGGYRLELRSPGAWSGQGAPFKVQDPQKMGQAADAAAPTLDLGALNLAKTR